MSKYANIEEICFTLSIFVHEIKNLAAATSAFEKNVDESNCSNVFLTTANDAIWRELISEVAKLFDPSSNGSNENCSFLRLRKECITERYHSLFPEGENDILIKKIDNLIQFYTSLPIKTSRNKQLGHYDMKQIFKNEPIKIYFTDIEKLIFMMSETLEAIYNRISFAKITISNYEDIKQRHECDLKKLLKFTNQ